MDGKIILVFFHFINFTEDSLRKFGIVSTLLLSKWDKYCLQRDLKKKSTISTLLQILIAPGKKCSDMSAKVGKN